MYTNISSTSNEKIKSIKKLYEKKHRDIEKKYIVEGIKIIKEAIKSNQSIASLVICKEIFDKINIDKNLIEEYINKKMDCKDCELIYVTENVIKYVSDIDTPQGIIAVLDKKVQKKFSEYINEEKIKSDLSKRNTILLLDRIQDSGNIGTIIRTASAFGLKNILLSQGCADIYSPKVLRSTMGNIFNINIFQLKDNEKDILLKLKEIGYKIYVTGLVNGEKLEDISFDKNSVLIVGNEANGVSKEIFDICDKVITIPMEKNTESLNVAIATGIILHKSYIS